MTHFDRFVCPVQPGRREDERMIYGVVSAILDTDAKQGALA